MYPPTPKCVIRLLGVPEIRVNGHLLSIQRRLVRALLYYVAAHPRGVSRDVIADLISPNTPQRVARRRLTRLLWHLRNALGEGYVHADAEHIWLDTACWVDVHAFTSTVEQIRQWQQPAEIPAPQQRSIAQALTLYRGEFLSGFALPHHSAFSEWLLLQREQLGQLFEDALAFLATACALQGKYTEAISYARRGLEVNPIREDLHRLLMDVYAHLGRRTDALRQYEQCVIALEKELGIDPLPETKALYQAILHRQPVPSLPLTPSLPEHVALADAPFVGRKRELRLLSEEWQHVQRGMGRIVFLAGEPGIGKTQLVQEFLRRERPRVWIGAGEPSMVESPYYPLQIALAKALPTLVPAIRQMPLSVLAETCRILPELRDYRTEIPPPLPPTVLMGKHPLFEALYRFIQAIVDRPTVLFLDDVHWTTETLWQWFHFFSLRLRSLPLLIILAYRPEEAPPPLDRFVQNVRHRGLARHVHLKGLSESELAQIIRHFTPHPTGFSSSSLRELSRQTGGNPYFVLETLRWMQERPHSEDTEGIPERVRDVLTYRLGLLHPLSRQILNAAAVLSPYLTVTLLARTAGRTEEETMRWVEDLLRRRLLVETGDPEPAYEFAHEQLRRVTYELIGVATRRHLHRRAAHALLAAPPSRVPNLHMVLARHWESAGNLPQALNALLKAIETAARQCAYSQVIDLATHALQIVERLPRTPAYLTAKTRVYLWRGRGLRARRRYKEARRDLDIAIRQAQILSDKDTLVEALDEKIHIAVDCWQEDEAITLAAMCAQIAESCRDTLLRARTLYLKEMVAVHFFKPVSEASLEKALRESEKAGLTVQVAEIWNLRGVAAMMQEDWERALYYFDRALQLATRVYHHFLIHRILANQGHVYYNIGDFRAAWEAFARAEDWVRNVGIERPDLLFEIGRAYVAIHLGRSQDAEQALHNALKLAQQMGTFLGQVYAHIHLAQLRYLQGRWQDAERLIRPFLERPKDMPPGTHVWLLELWGRLLRARGEHKKALKIHKKAARRAHQSEIPRRLASSLCEVGMDLIHLGHPEAARRVFQVAKEVAERHQMQGAVAMAWIGLATVDPHQEDVVKRALAVSQTTGSLILQAEAARVAHQVHDSLQDITPLLHQIRVQVREAGWQGLY